MVVVVVCVVTVHIPRPSLAILIRETRTGAECEPVCGRFCVLLPQDTCGPQAPCPLAVTPCGSVRETQGPRSQPQALACPAVLGEVGFLGARSPGVVSG